MKSIGYFLMGLGAGTALAMMYAPRAGAETRDFLSTKAAEGADYAKRSANDGLDYAKRQADELKKSAAAGIDRGKTAVMAPVAILSSAVEAGKQAYTEARSKAGEVIA